MSDLPLWLAPRPPPVPVEAPAPAAQIEQEIQQSAISANGPTIYCGEVTFSWLQQLSAWFRKR